MNNQTSKSKLSWATPSLKTLDMEKTLSATQVSPFEQVFTTGPNAGQPNPDDPNGAPS